MNIILATDHRGFYLKEELKDWLMGLGHDVLDVGNHEYDQEDDFPDFASQAGRKVVENVGSRGIVFCGSGAGVSVVVNKIAGVRGSIGMVAEQVQAARADDDINILVIAADYTQQDRAKEMIEAFLSTEFKAEERHLRRLEKIAILEKK